MLNTFGTSTLKNAINRAHSESAPDSSIAALTSKHRSHPSRVHFWRADRRIGNFGDALNLPILKALGLSVGPAWPGQVDDSCASDTPVLFALGSILDPINLAHYNGPISVWGSGWRGVELPASLLGKITFHAVRGPHTQAALTRAGVANAAGLPLGDPAFLMPWLFPKLRRIRATQSAARGPHSTHGRRLLMPHFLAQNVPQPRQVGCDARLNPHVAQRYGRWDPTAPSVDRVSARILKAGFLLTGAMHGAIVAQAFGVPWAMWRSCGLDCPAKWAELGQFLGISIEGVENAEQGLDWWQSVGRLARVPNMAPIVAALPVRNQTIDNLLSEMTKEAPPARHATQC